MIIRYQSGLGFRVDVPNFLNKQKLLGTMVEVGVHRGEYLSCFSNLWFGKRIYGVDPWVNYDGSDPASIGDRQNDKRIAEKALKKDKRVTLIQEFSSIAVNQFENASLDFVHIDANHQHDYVLADLIMWWEKVREGGYLMVHDYICSEPGGGWGSNIQPAVHKFAEDRDILIGTLVPDLNTGVASLLMKK